MKIISTLWVISSIYYYSFYVFRAEIRRLNKLLSEIPSHRSSQMADLSELDENLRESTGDEAFAMESQ